MISSESARDEAEAVGIRVDDALRARIATISRPTVLPLRASAFADACLVLPWYERERLTKHLVLLAGGGTGTMEVWAPDAREANLPVPLRLSSGHFGELREFFRLTAATKFGWDEGLPGQAASRRDCVVFSDLAESSAFLRASAATSVGLKCGFALPVYHPTGMDVATLLLGGCDKSRCRIDTWAAGTNVAHAEQYGAGSAPELQHAIAASLAESIARSGAPSVVRHSGTGTTNGERFAFGWIGMGSTSLPHILTVVT